MKSCPGRLIGGCLLALAAFLAWTNAARADIGLSKDGVGDGLGFRTDAVDVTLYGVLDVGFGSLDHSYGGSDVFASTINPYNLNSSPKSFNGIYSGGASMSSVGLKGKINLGYDVKALFKLESAIDVNSGTLGNAGRSVYNNVNALTTANGASAINGQWFSRAAYVGLSHPDFGSIEAGRTTNFSLDQTVQYDPVQAAPLFSPLGFSGGIGGGLGATENTRLDNSLKYENRINNVDFGFQYKFAGSANNQDAGSAYVGMLGYSNGSMSIKGTYSQTTNSVVWPTQYSNVVAPTSTLQIENTSGYMISGKYAVNPDATVKAGYEYTTITAPSDKNMTDIVQYYGLTMSGPAANMTGEQILGTLWFGGDYKITRDFDIAGGYYNINTFNSPEVGKDYHSNAYSLLADYTFCKGLDAYAGAMILRYSGAGLYNKAPVMAYPGNAMYGLGLRMRF